MKPSIPKGTRDFSPTEVAKRNYIFSIIKSSFENFGFQPIETPSFENSATLMGKYGEEGDRLIFKVLESGDYLKDVKLKDMSPVEWGNLIQNEAFRNDFLEKTIVIDAPTLGDLTLNDLKQVLQSKEYNLNELTSKISKKALRYDLTVPFARYVVQHQNEISFPFKRYQMQPVWRADRPQKGRFREFFQCDADVVGSKSLMQEIEFVQLYDDVFTKLKLEGVTIKMNNRKILAGIAEIIGASDKLIDFTVALDKLDKIGAEGVTTEMLAKGITQEAIDKVQPLFNFKGSNTEKLSQLKGMLKTSDEGLRGVEDLQFVMNAIDELGLQSAKLEVDVTLARGLNYYTGAIFEVSAPESVQIGSIGGGGRYDDLTGIFGLKDVSGVGISFGLDRIYLVLEELDLFDTVVLPKPKVVFLNFDEEAGLSQLKAIKKLRENNIKSELYPDLGKSNKQQKKQWKYVTTREIEYVVSKIVNDTFILKNMNTGKQTECSLSEMIKTLK